MATLDRPQLRPLSASRVDHQGRPFLALQDSLGLIPSQVLIPLDLFQRVVRHFDGSKSLDEIHQQIVRETDPGFAVSDLNRLVAELDRNRVLDGPTFRQFAADYAKAESRPAALAGRSYPKEPDKLREFLARFFTDPKGSGPISDRSPGRSLRAILCPHIDFGRGGPVYTWAYRELVEKSDADVFVILGVAHQSCRNRFALTRKDFETPLGKVITNRAFVESLAEQAGNHFFDDELAHRTEHSIEFQAVFLQYLLGGRRDFTIVPILVGSFHDLMTRKVNPIDDPEVRRMVEALKTVEAATGRKVAYIGGIDLCHVGPEFGDASPVSDATLEEISTFDATMLNQAANDDPAGWFETARAIDNRWRVCGLAATYTMLHAIGPARGKILSYDQAVNPSRTCCVSFASVAYELISP